MIKRDWLAPALLLLISSPAAMAADVTITTGGKGGSYYSTGEKLADMLRGFDHDVTVERSAGSVENIKRVASGEATLGFTQLDALAWWMGRNPSPAGQSPVKVLGNLFSECVYIAVNRKGPISNEGDLETDKARIAVQKQGSGSAVTWEYMRELEPGYTKATVVFDGGMQALARLAAEPDGDINAFMWVNNPDSLDQRYLQTVLGNDALELIDVDDKDLNDKFEPLGRPIYRFEEPDVAKGLIFDDEIETICMDAVVIANPDTDDETLDDMADIMLNQKDVLLTRE
ncbi:TAXI family TRAP transporter solute-binding subunit [Granulosicoccaceae sp. 1_MG-2023]|nr:TAXI family TRAP transporter solute-binding subunit [Granulosicoccaceae sp. 1_MG-2023]